MAAKKKKKSASKARKAPKKAATKKVSPVPKGYSTVTPHLVLRGAARAIDFYKKAFGAKERMRMGGPDGNIGHAELQIGSSIVMCADEMPQMGSSAPETVGGSPVHIFLYVPDVDKIFGQAVQAGAKVDMPLTDMFWGDRYGKVTDPFGHHWSMATHVEDVSPKEMERRAAAWAAQQK
jgi:PhnB protein